MLDWAWPTWSSAVVPPRAVGVCLLKAPTVYEPDQIFVGIIVIGLLGLISDRIFAFLNRRLYPWA